MTDSKEATSELIFKLIEIMEIKKFGIIIFQNEKSFDRNIGKYLNNLIKRDIKWLHIILSALEDAQHVMLLCKSFTMLNIVAFYHITDEIFDQEIAEVIELKPSDAISWLIEKADLEACMGLLWSSAMWLNTQSLHILGSKILFGYGHLLDQTLIAAKDLVTIGRIGDLNIETNTPKSLELEELYMSRHTYSWTNIFGHSAIDRIYESFYTMHPEKNCVMDGIKEYLKISIFDTERARHPMIMSRKRQLLSLAGGRRCQENRKSWDTSNFTFASICSAGYSGTILVPTIISNEGLTTGAIKINFSNEYNTIAIPASNNPSELYTKTSVESILGNLRQWWAKIEKLASSTKMELSVYSLLARTVGLQGSEMQLAGVVISGSVQWNRTQLRYMRVIRDIAFAISYLDEQWNLAWDTDGKMVLHNGEINANSFIAICAGQGIFGGYVSDNDTAKGVALLALNDAKIETMTIK